MSKKSKREQLIETAEALFSRHGSRRVTVLPFRRERARTVRTSVRTAVAVGAWIAAVFMRLVACFGRA